MSSEKSAVLERTAARSHTHYEDITVKGYADEETCGCGHDHAHGHVHEDACGCGHDHTEHAHEDSRACDHDHGGGHHHEHHAHGSHQPGHPADCQCELCHPHADYCDVCGESLQNCKCRMPDEDCVKRVYILENLGCANCAAKMEYKIKELPGVKYAAIAFATKQLRLSAKEHEALLPKIQEICASIESQVVVKPRMEKNPGVQVTRTYLLENLGCANCAAKMEREIAQLEGVTSAVLTFATRQLRVTGKNPDALLARIQEICASIEGEVVVNPRNPAVREEKASAKTGMKKETKDLLEIVAGALLFILGELLEKGYPSISLPIFIAAYILLGWRIVFTALKNIRTGRVFDENFLMSVATLGAFAIQEYPEAVGVMLFFRVGEFFEHKAVERSRSQIMEAIDLRPEEVNLDVGGQIKAIPAQDAHVGDILLVRAGDRIPLDGVILEGESRLDTSPITGEPVPVSVGFGSEVVSGCVNLSGVLKMRVEKELSESMVTRILDSVENAAASKPKIDRFITRFARVYTPIVVLAAILTAVVPSLITGEWGYWTYTALTFLVISCPCALVLSVPLAFFSGIGAGSKRGILFKGGVSIEALKNVKAVIMDKTGTVTKGEFVLQKAQAAQGVQADALLALCACCEMDSTHPIAVSIVSAAKEKNLKLTRPERLEEIAGKGIRAALPQGEALCGNRALLESAGVQIPEMEENTFGTEVFAALEGRYLGRLVISDTIKPEAPGAISRLKEMGVNTAMLTGDAPQSAAAVAQATGIGRVEAKLLPQDKLNALRRIRDDCGSVMFVGDGINDAPVLAGADVGAAMGSGADAAIEAADVVFMTSSMQAVPQSIDIARRTASIAYQNVAIALSIKALVMVLGLAGFASMWMAVFADTGVAMLCVLNSVRILYMRDK